MNDDEYEQDWEPVVWKKTKEELQQFSDKHAKEEIPFSRKLSNARQRAQMTQNKLSQALGIKLRDLESYEEGKSVPENNVIARINKLLNSNFSL